MPTVEIPGMGTVAFPDDMSDADISKEAAKLYRKNKPTMARMAGTVAQEMNSLPLSSGGLGGMFGAAKLAMQNLPSVLGGVGEGLGGLGGGLLGAATGPAAPAAVPALGFAGKVGGGAAGGYVGRVATNVLASGPAGEYFDVPEPESLTQGAGTDALIQGASSAIGVPLAAGAKRLGGVLTGRTLAHAAAKTEKLVREAADAGVELDATEALRNMHVLAAESGLVSEKMRKAVGKLAEDFMKTNKGTINALRAHKMIQAADDIAKPVWDQIEKARRGLTPPPGPRTLLKARFYKDAATQLRAKLRDLVPGYEELQTQVQRAANARSKIPYPSEGPIHPKLTNLGGSTEILARALGSPDAMTNYGNALSGPFMQMLLGQGPRIAAAPFRSTE